MPYLVGQDFRLGVDRRRRRVAGAPGSLWSAINCHLTRGGDIEKRKKFVAKWKVPANTFGLKVSVGVGYIFGSDAPAGITNPAGTTYQQFVSPNPTAPAMTALNDVALFNGQIYAIATFADGNTHHYFNGVRVAAWDDGVVRSYNTIGDMASNISALINANSAERATATVAGQVITITAKSVNVPLSITAEALNGGLVDDQTAVVAITTAADASHAEVTTVTLGGTLDIGDRFSVFVGAGTSHAYGANGNPLSKGARLFTFGTKMYVLSGSLAYFSAVADCLSWRANLNGAGFINMSIQEQGSLTLTGVGKYQTQLAFFSSDACQIWTLDPDPTKNAIAQTLLNTGAIAGRSVVSYGTNDTFYLSRSGLRSLRMRSQIGAPFASDTGNAIDKLLIEQMRILGPSVTGLAKGDIETIDGRYMLALGSAIYILSDFPGSKVSAWSWYLPTEIPNFSADWVSVDTGKYYVRSGSTIYLYGGDDGNTYDSSPADNYVVTVGLPFSGGKKLANKKTATSYGLDIENTWGVSALVDSRDENRKIFLGTATQDTYPDNAALASFEGAAYALEFVCAHAGPATLTNYAVNYDEFPLEEGV